MPLGFCARFKVPVNWQEQGVGVWAKLANDAHGPVLYISKTKPWIIICKERWPSRLRYAKFGRWRSPGRWYEVVMSW